VHRHFSAERRPSGRKHLRYLQEWQRRFESISLLPSHYRRERETGARVAPIYPVLPNWRGAELHDPAAWRSLLLYGRI